MAEPYIETWSGLHFHPWKPKPEEVDLKDIAHALSLQCRFNGHVTRFYSVAEHAIIMSRLVEPCLELAALIHDAAEAYIGDMAHPIKASGQMDAYEVLDELVTRAICAKFDVEYGQTQDEGLKALDRRLCATEARVLFQAVPGWTTRYTELEEEFHPKGLSPTQAERAFLKRFKEVS